MNAIKVETAMSNYKESAFKALASFVNFVIIRGMIVKQIAILCAVAALLSACGSSSGISSDVPSGTLPVVARVEPDSGSSGDTISIYGVGFSSAAPYNIVIIGGAGVSAISYDLLPSPSGDEVEVITATVPPGAIAGEDSVVVMVHENISNADVTFTVN